MLRQVLVGILALQLLNVAIGSQPASDTDYDYSYTWNSSYDPTETAVEWIVEMECGQQSRFSYDKHSDSSRNIIKSCDWQASPPVIECQPLVCILPAIKLQPAGPAQAIPSPIKEILTPPPQQA